MKIVLLGYMASGKTIIANELAKKLKLKHIDLDYYIEEREKMPIPLIFKEYGEIKFRILENKYLKEVLDLKENFVLSVGGGTPCYANNMNLILDYAVSIYLNANINTLYSRLIKNKKTRPLITEINNKKLKEFIAKHLFERNIFYNKANFSVTVNNKSILKINREIISLL